MIAKRSIVSIQLPKKIDQSRLIDTTDNSALNTTNENIASTNDGINRRIFSKESEFMSFDTLFDDFNLKAEPVYNFWVANELESENETASNRQLNDIPRYIKLSWNTCPVLNYERDTLSERSVTANSFRASILKEKIKPAINVEGITFNTNSRLQDIILAKSSLANDTLDNGITEIKFSNNQRAKLDNLIAEKSYIDNFVKKASKFHTLENLIKLNNKSNDVYKRDFSIQNFPENISSSELRAVDDYTINYVGYVIEKYKKLQDGFTKIEEINIDSRSTNYFIDTKVLYGTIYRYKVRCIIRWTRKSNINVDGVDATASSDEFISSYFNSSWSDWVYTSIIDLKKPNCPDELTVIPKSHKKHVIITCKIPDNSQRDFYKIDLYKRIKKNEKIIQDIKLYSSILSNLCFVDEDVEYFQKSGNEYCYYAKSVDVHGQESLESEHIVCKLNKFYDNNLEFEVIQTQEKEERMIPVNKNEKFVCNDIYISVKEGSVQTQLQDKTYILRFISIDTGEIKDLPIDIRFTNNISSTTVSANQSSDINAQDLVDILPSSQISTVTRPRLGNISI